MIKITPELLSKAFSWESGKVARWVDALCCACSAYEINTRNRIASFLAQTAYESEGFQVLDEQLNYTAQRLVAIWPRRFACPEVAKQYAMNPEGLANYVYANRNGNGSEASGDGYRFRGRGLIQLTGRSNYGEAGVALSVDLINHPDLLLQPEHAALASAWFWTSRKLNSLADEISEDSQQAFARITQIINGGSTGLSQRWEKYKLIESRIV